MVLVDPYPFSSFTWPSSASLRRLAWSRTRSCHSLFTSLSIILLQPPSLDKNPRSRSADLYLCCFPFKQTITSNNTSLYSIVLFQPSTYSNLGTFLVHLSIVLSLRKAPFGLEYKPAHVSLFPLASSALYLLSNLVSSLGLPVWLKPHKLLVTRSPSKKTSLDLSLDLGLTDLSSLHHCPKDTDRNSTCPCTIPECALLEIWLCRPHNKRTSSLKDHPYHCVEGHRQQ